MLNYELRKNISATLNMTGVVISRDRKRTEKSRDPSASLRVTGWWVAAQNDRSGVAQNDRVGLLGKGIVKN